MRRVAVLLITLATVLLCAPVASAAPASIVLTPGAKLNVWDARGAPAGTCTAGFIARNRRGTPVLMDAGHCDRGGDVSMPGPGGEVAVGQFVVSTFDGTQSEDTDIAVLKLSAGIDVHGDIAGTLPITGWVPYVVEGQVLCKNGAVTGRTCGPVVDVSPSKVKFAAEIAQGDSGGPVYALKDDGTAAAVGITIRLADDDGFAVAELIGPWLTRWDLTII